MNILIQNTPTVIGFYNALFSNHQQRHKLVVWEENKSAFDIFTEVEPNLVFLDESKIDRATEKCITNEPEIYVVTYCNNKFQLTLNDQILTTYQPMIDHIVFHAVEPKEYMQCDLAFIGNNNDIINNLCFPIGKLKIKVFGLEHLGIAQYLGQITHNERLDMYASSTICFADTIEGALRICASQGCCLTTENKIGEILDEGLVVSDVDELRDVIHNFTINPELRQKHIQHYYDMFIPEFTHKYIIEKFLETQDWW